MKLIFIFFIVIFILSTPIFSQSKKDFGDFLMKDQDYFRAISTYKELFYFSSDLDTKKYCLSQIAKAYWKSGRYKASIKFLTRLLNQPQMSQDYYNNAMIYMGLNYYGLKVNTMAEDYLLKVTASDTIGFSHYYLALLEVEKGNFEKASTKFKEIYGLHPYSNIGIVSNQLSSEVLKGYKIKHKIPFLAVSLSAILPGTGQFYCHHYYDGIQAFLYVSAFAFATYAIYKYDNKFNNNYINTYISISITSLFHLGNIIGADRTARYYNLKQKQNFLDKIRNKVFSVEF